MSTKLTVMVLGFAVILLLLVLFLLQKNKIRIKYSLIWILSSVCIIIISMIPNFMLHLANFFGFELLSNMVLCIFIGLLLLISLMLTVMMTKERRRTTLLIQEISLLKKELEERK